MHQIDTFVLDEIVLSFSVGTFGLLIGKLDEGMRECSQSGGNRNLKLHF